MIKYWRLRKMLQTISIENFHQCDDDSCQTTWEEIKDEDGFTLRMDLVTNPSYNLTTQRCAKYGQTEVCYINIARYYQNSTKYDFVNPDELIINKSDVRIMFEYPLKNPLIYRAEAPQVFGFTRRNLIDIIVTKYHDIYQEEKDTTQIPILSMQERLTAQNNLMNPNSTNGTFGVWGHDIEDLFIDGIQYDPLVNLISLVIGS